MEKEFEEIAKFCNHEHCGEVCNLVMFIKKHFLPKSVVKEKIEKLFKRHGVFECNGTRKYEDWCEKEDCPSEDARMIKANNKVLSDLLKDLDL